MNDQPTPVDCQEAADRLYEYLDGELTPEIELAVRAHIAECAPCFKRFDFEETFLRFLAGRIRSQGAPPELKRRILESLFSDSDLPERE